MTEIQNVEAELRDDVEELRNRFERTPELYREVCSLMFFRYSMTPTATKLYQLVRKGSMSVPTQVLRAFWNDVRQKGKVHIEHAGLPADLADFAGDLVGKLWSAARQSAEDSLEAIRDAAAVERNAAILAEESVREELGRKSAEAEQLQGSLEEAGRALAEAREEAAGLKGSMTEIHRRLADVQDQLAAAEKRQSALQANHAANIESILARSTKAEERHAAAEKRSLIEIDRERQATSRLEKALERERTDAITSLEQLRAELSATNLQLARSLQSEAALRMTLEHAGVERDLAQRGKEEANLVIIELGQQLAAERARIAELRERLVGVKDTARKVKIAKKGAAQHGQKD